MFFYFYIFEVLKMNKKMDESKLIQAMKKRDFYFMVGYKLRRFYFISLYFRHKSLKYDLLVSKYNLEAVNNFLNNN